MKIANRKKWGIVGDDIGGFRVQYAFPNMETFAFLDRKGGQYC